MCIIPGVFLSVLFSATISVLAVEEGGVFNAIGRSWVLMKTRLWAYLGTFIVAGLVSICLYLVLTLVPTGIAVAAGSAGLDPIAWLFIAGASVASGFITLPFGALVPALLYFDARVRNEGFDVEMMAARMQQDMPMPDGISAESTPSPDGSSTVSTAPGETESPDIKDTPNNEGDRDQGPPIS